MWPDGKATHYVVLFGRWFEINPWKNFHCHSLPKETKPVKCKILRPDGSSAKSPVYIYITAEINGEYCSWWEQKHPGLFGRIYLPFLNFDSVKDFCCYMKSPDGYLIIKDSSRIRKGARLQLKTGAKILPQWKGGNPMLMEYSIECDKMSELHEGISFPSPDQSQFQLQYPPGAFCLHSSGDLENYKDSHLSYTKWGVIKAGQVNVLELGKNLSGYEIKCLLPDVLPRNGSLVLALLPKRNPKELMFGLESTALFSGKDAIDKKIADEVEEWYFESLPLNDGAFRFVAHDDGCSVAVMLSDGDDDENKTQIATVEFKKGEPRKKTIDLRMALAGREVS